MLLKSKPDLIGCPVTFVIMSVVVVDFAVGLLIVGYNARVGHGLSL